MNELRPRLVNCFRAVFPELTESQILTARQDSVAECDSVAAISLVNVIEEEFGIEMDFDALADLNTFDHVCAYLEKEIKVS